MGDDFLATAAQVVTEERSIMRRLTSLAILTALCVGASPVLADGGVPAKYRANAQKALKWLVDQPNKRAGPWDAADQGSPTVTEVQSRRAARNAGIKVPNDAIKMAQEYLKQSTGADGGVVYSLAHGAGGGGRPALTAAAISCGFSSGDYNSPQIKKWFQFCERQVPLLRGARFGHDEYTHYYYAQALYMLGDDGYGKLFPESKATDRLGW